MGATPKRGHCETNRSSPPPEPESAVETARRQLRRAAHRLDIDPSVVERLKSVRDEDETRTVTRRAAAYIVALSRIAEAHDARGLWP